MSSLGRRFAVDLAGRIAILELANQAQAVVMGGVKPGDLRWSHPARDFFWHDVSGGRVFMDAYQFLILARRVMEHGEERRLRTHRPTPTDPVPTDLAPTDLAPTDPAPTDLAPTDLAPLRKQGPMALGVVLALRCGSLLSQGCGLPSPSCLLALKSTSPGFPPSRE
ncbi:MAG: hypothetical protein GY948_16035 [Alphaproteobacteria bacterium]|nr:hypothetical protein [Alphaproteobacteria bacterium]